jgi:DNA repair protein RecO (recombination protein O)
MTPNVGGVLENGSVQGYRDDGVVLRTQKLGEADRIVTLLTRQNGRVRAVAKGVRRTKSRFGARLEPFTHVDVLIHPGRSLDVITQAEVIRPYGVPLAGDYPRYTAGTAMLETAERFTPMEKEPAIRQFLLLIGGLRALGEIGEIGETGETGEAGETPKTGDTSTTSETDETGAAGREGREPQEGREAEGRREPRQAREPREGEAREPREPRLVLDAYLLRSLAVAGYAPSLEECARCGATGAQLTSFAVAAGGMVCGSCRSPGAASPSAQTVALMLALLRGDWDNAMRSERRQRVECSGLVAAYLQWHLEHSIRSLRHVERA